MGIMQKPLKNQRFERDPASATSREIEAAIWREPGRGSWREACQNHWIPIDYHAVEPDTLLWEIPLKEGFVKENSVKGKFR